MRRGFVHQGELHARFIPLCLTHKWKKINQTLSWTTKNTLCQLSRKVKAVFLLLYCWKYNSQLKFKEIIWEVTWQDGKRMHCKYLPVVPYKALENFSKALYGTTGGTYSACIIRPVMSP